MSIEQRLTDALRTADRVQPAPDLFARVVHSIEEDREHRRRVVRAFAATFAAATAFAGAVLVSLSDSSGRTVVRWRSLELIETGLLIVLVVVLGPAIRRFGRGYAHDLWPSSPETATQLLRLLDLAYALVAAGYILMTVELQGPPLGVANVGAQLGEVAIRVGGLVVVLGVLHALTLVALPMVALVSNATRAGRPIPRWVLFMIPLLVVVPLPVAWLLLLLLIGSEERG